MNPICRGLRTTSRGVRVRLYFRWIGFSRSLVRFPPFGMMSSFPQKVSKSPFHARSICRRCFSPFAWRRSWSRPSGVAKCRSISGGKAIELLIGQVAEVEVDRAAIAAGELSPVRRLEPEELRALADRGDDDVRGVRVALSSGEHVPADDGLKPSALNLALLVTASLGLLRQGTGDSGELGFDTLVDGRERLATSPQSRAS